LHSPEFPRPLVHPRRNIDQLPDFTARPPRMRYCSRCCYPMIAVFVTLDGDEEAVCSGCRVNTDIKNAIDWDQRQQMLKDLLDEYGSPDGSTYDCLIPVSGGKDSWFQVDTIVNRFHKKPLLVTYHGNNYTDVGMRNLIRMREVFGCDHVFFTPNIRVLEAMNRLGFRIQGDMNWHSHCGIFTYPIQVAVRQNIPLMIWGEHGPTDLGGQLSLNDLVEMNARIRLEHMLRGFDWPDFVEAEEGLSPQDLLWAMYPSDDDLERVGVRQIFLGNYVYWDANEHGQRMIDEYGFQIAEEPFDRTYRRMSNLDDMHENGIHDFMKYIKFGYGRCTDHVCKDIRAGVMTRAQGIERIREHDHVKPRDLFRWLPYVGMSEEEFDATADTFRDPRVWWKDNGQWRKDNLWDDPK
jgi:N-acetyl sugar amidotransferase